MALELDMLQEHLSYLKKTYDDAVLHEKSAVELNKILEQMKLVMQMIAEYNTSNESCNVSSMVAGSTG